MKKFAYSMQSILNIKQKLEEQERNNYAQAQIRLNAETDKLDALKTEREDFFTKCQQELSEGTVDVLKMKFNEEKLSYLKEAIRTQTIAVRKAEQNVEAALHKLSQAMMERKGQEKLREKAFAQYTAEMEAQERKEVDELVSFRYGMTAK